ncbi:Histone methylation protein [Phytophthora palmivora]|uniref:Histone-lysine N-methyltransferase, H3 lysine-79 specific n=1 Tax=Phytophthora palmivora TaxID=4796 RepID=A0A2P4X0L9_9STRA|nr:Histone methylation protein [Phytophthora palmivora]
MATTFQDWEDKQLVQIALRFELEGLRITWDYVAHQMKRTKRPASELRTRLATLKRTNGKTISKFQPCFFGSVKPLFAEMSAESVRQHPRKINGTAGELLPSGVSELLGAMGPASTSDIFVDIRAGIGNVVSQVALATNVKASIGIEVRNELWMLSERCIKCYSCKYPLLLKVSMMNVDVQDAALSFKSPTCHATLVFTNNFLFEESAKLVISRELCSLPKARVVGTSSLVFPRHRASCVNIFCARWKRERTLKAPCSWKATTHSLFIYRRKR